MHSIYQELYSVQTKQCHVKRWIPLTAKNNYMYVFGEH